MPIGTGSWTTGAKPTSSRWPNSEPPTGHDHWTLRLLAGKVVELGVGAPLYPTITVRLHLKKTPSSRGRSRTLVHSKGERRVRGSYEQDVHGPVRRTL